MGRWISCAPSAPPCAGAGTVELRALTDAVNAAVGPFPAFTHELAASARAHLAEI